MEKSLLYIANFRMPTEKAHGLQVARMCDAFVSAGISLELVLPKRPFIKETIKAYYQLQNELQVTYVPVWDLTGKIPFFGFLIQSLHFAAQALRTIRSRRYSGPIYTRDQFTAFMLALFVSNRLYYEVHTIPAHAFFLYRRIFRRSSKIIVISNGLREALIARGIPSDKIVVEHDGVSASLPALAPEAIATLRREMHLPVDSAIVLYAGSFIPWKGVDTYVHAALDLPAQYHSLALGGTGDNLDRIRAILGTRTASVEIRPYVKQSEVMRYYSIADILVLPNSGREDISRLYTSPLKLFEYLATDTPLVISDLPSLREIGDQYEGIWFFRPDDAQDLCRVIQEIPLGKRFHRDISKYYWYARAERISKLLYSTHA